MKKEYTKMKLPFEGEWFVLCGGYLKKDSHSWNVKNQRYAYDFVKIDSYGNHYKLDKYVLENHYCYGQRVLAPKDGVVVSVRNNIKDNKVLIKDKDVYKYGLGNYITMQHSKKVFSTIGHLKEGSITCKIGDILKTGDVLGLAGNSGNSNYPHVHFQVQNKKSLFLAKSLPIKFIDTYIKFKDIKISSEKISKNMKVGLRK